MLLLTEIRDLAYRFVPVTAADSRLYTSGHRSFWPAHEIGHFLVATADECRQSMFGLDTGDEIGRPCAPETPLFHYVISREIAAISISQRLLRRIGRPALADEEIQYTDENTLECGFETWCKRAVHKLLRTNRIVRLPTTFEGMELLLKRKAREVETPFYPSCPRRRADPHLHLVEPPREVTVRELGQVTERSKKTAFCYRPR